MKKVLIALSLLSGSSFAGGFEKVTMWSAKWSSLAGAAAAGTEGAESIYFNPAGLVYGNSAELSLNMSSTGSKFSGPVNQNNANINSESQVSPIGGAVGSLRLSDSFAVGFGAYVAGGNNSYFPDVSYQNLDPDFSGFKSDIQSEIGLVEMSVGAGLKITKNWSIGAAWRASFAKANFAAADTREEAGGLIKLAIAQKFEDLEDNDFRGFRLGTQYRSTDGSWGLGASFRSRIKLQAKGKSSGQQQLASIRHPMFELPGTELQDLDGGGDVTLETSFPYQISFGGFFEPHKHWRINAEVTHTDYSAHKKVGISGNPLISTAATEAQARGAMLRQMQALGRAQQLAAENNMQQAQALMAQAAAYKQAAENLSAAAAAGKGPDTLRDIEQNWKDQQNYKVGIQYFGIPRWELRTGYALTTQVTDSANARATFSTPGTAHTVVLGAGSSAFKGRLGYDVGAEYSFAKANNFGSGAKTEGEYTTDAYVLHTSLKYNF